MHTQILILLVTSFAFLSFIFVYWKDATEEGFGSDKIFDSAFLILLGGILGGKLLFRPLSIDYITHNFLNSPLVLEGVLIGGGISAFIVIKKNNWSAWKIGDMIAPALAIFQFILFSGFYYIARSVQYLVLAAFFLLLFLFLKYLKNKKHFGSSQHFFELKRLNKIMFTGGLLAIYLTASSLVAILFLLINLNSESKFWWFQLLFYISIIVVTLYSLRRRFVKKEINMASVKNLPSDFINKMRFILKRREKEVVEELKETQENDPFTVESEEAGGRNVDELGDDVQELEGHTIASAEEEMLKEERKNVEKALKNIEKGTYGICEKCGNPIEKERLEIDPTTTLCAKCAKESENK